MHILSGLVCVWMCVCVEGIWSMNRQEGGVCLPCLSLFVRTNLSITPRKWGHLWKAGTFCPYFDEQKQKRHLVTATLFGPHDVRQSPHKSHVWEALKEQCVWKLCRLDKDKIDKVCLICYMFSAYGLRTQTHPLIRTHSGLSKLSARKQSRRDSHSHEM